MLEVEGVTAGYGGEPVLRDVDVSVGPGEVVGLIGPNGSGKSTLVRVVSRTLKPFAGRVRLAGRDAYSLGAGEVARTVAVVPQGIQAFFPFTVLELILMGRVAHASKPADDYRHARRAAELASVQHLSERTLEEISGGERQRVVLAQALAQATPILLLDEPTTHLDPRHAVAILDLTRSLAREERRAVLAIFHDLTLAAAYCDRLVALSAGEVVAEGPPPEVVTPALLRDVYEVEGDVLPNPLTGRPAVLLGPPLARATGSMTAHVIGGAGRGAPAMRVLAELGYHVSTGVVHDTDTDADVAARLNLERVVVPPFSPIDREAERAAGELASRAQLLVLCRAPYGPGNVANLRIAAAALEAGVRTVVVGGPTVEDFTGGAAQALWRSISERAQLASSYDELSDLLAT